MFNLFTKVTVWVRYFFNLLKLSRAKVYFPKILIVDYKYT